jgi:hypothetical protein
MAILGHFGVAEVDTTRRTVNLGEPPLTTLISRYANYRDKEARAGGFGGLSRCREMGSSRG